MLCDTLTKSKKNAQEIRMNNVNKNLQSPLIAGFNITTMLSKAGTMYTG